MYSWAGVAEWREQVRATAADASEPPRTAPQRRQVRRVVASRSAVSANAVAVNNTTTARPAATVDSSAGSVAREPLLRTSRSLPHIRPNTKALSEVEKLDTVSELSSSIDTFLFWLHPSRKDPAPQLPDLNPLNFRDIIPPLRIIKVKMADARAQTVANNRSLRTIKNELESLVENGVITDQQYDTILASLPAEAPLRGGHSATPAATSGLDTSFAAMNVQTPASRNPSPAPLPPRATPAPPPYKNEIGHAVALYDYPGNEANDLSLSRGDHISVTEHMNAEWWSGTNVRTRKEGIFPANYVRTESGPSGIAQAEAHNEKAGFYGQSQGGYPAQPQNPYKNSVPPMAIANNSQSSHAAPEEPKKGQQMASKFGKKLGNAAIFGAGATIGGNIVNSIF